MGWVSYIEDNLERLNDSIRREEAALEDKKHPTEEQRRAGLRTLNDAKVILAEMQQHWELATSPELDLAHEIMNLKKCINSLQSDLTVAKREAGESNHESARRFAELQDAKHEITEYRKENRKLKEQFEKVARNHPDAAYEAFSTPSMLREHKPNRQGFV